MVKGSDARERMVRGAARLLAQRGLQGTSFADVIAATGAPRGSIYHHFPGGKQQLVAEAVHGIGTSVAERLLLLAGAEGLTPVQVVDAYTAGWRQLLVGSDFRAGCAIGNVTAGAGDDAPDLLVAASGAFAAWHSALDACLRAAKVADADADRFASLMIASMEGAVLLARAERDITRFDAVASSLRDAAGALPVRTPAPAAGTAAVRSGRRRSAAR